MGTEADALVRPGESPDDNSPDDAIVLGSERKASLRRWRLGSSMYPAVAHVMYGAFMDATATRSPNKFADAG